MRILTPLSLLVPLLLSPLGAGARDDADMNLEITSEKQGAEAKQDAFDQATEEATRRWVEDLLGPERAQAQWAAIKGKILKNSSRYILFMKGSQPVVSGATNKISVQMRIAPDALESLMREMGVFGGGGVRLLTLVKVRDGRGGTYSWWADADGSAGAGTAREYFKKIYGHINQQFRAKSIYVLDPLNPSFRLGLPAAYRSEGLKREDQAMLGRYLHADAVLTGRVEVNRIRPEGADLRLDYDLQLWQSKNGHAVAESVRGEALASGNSKVISAALDAHDKRVFAELAQKLAEAAASGNLNLAVLNVGVNGDLSFREQKEMRRQIADLREVRAVRERLLEPGRVLYEVETPASAAELAKAIQRGRQPGTMNVEVGPDNGLVLTPRGPLTR